jgi:hypothetical protein
MEKQQRFVIKLLWLREYSPRLIYQELLATLGSDAYSEDSVHYWIARFQSGDTSCENISRPGRPLTDLAEPCRLFRQNDPFVSARMLSWHFSVCATTAKEIFAGDLGLKKLTQRWVPHTLSDPQKVMRVHASSELLQILNDLEAVFWWNYNRRWVIDHYLCESSAMFAKSPGDVIPRTRKEFGVKKTMSPILYTNRKLLIAECLRKCQKHSQDYIITNILPALER